MKPKSRRSTSTGSAKQQVPRALAVLGACAVAHSTATGAGFSEDLEFLKAHTDIIVLSDASGQAKVALAPRWQGRVLTSTAQGESGASFGWINRELIAARKLQPHINVFGGEDRFWMGPEGGQFSIFFAAGAAFDLEHWQTPAPIDTQAFEVVEQSGQHAQFRHAFTLTNYSGTRFDVAVNRTVRLLEPANTWRLLGTEPSASVHLVAFESLNRIRNIGQHRWRPESGLLSIWILGMFNPSPATTIVIPFRPGPEEELGKRVTADYFGPVPPQRLVIKDEVLFFRGDGRFRSKIGIGPRRCKPVLGSYDAAQKALTIVQFTLPAGETNYVNSQWRIQDQPYEGDAVNSYNDGPASPSAKPLGPFYELESSSPAAALEAGDSLEHVHRTVHMTGPEPELDRVARKVLGVSLREITDALPRIP